MAETAGCGHAVLVRLPQSWRTGYNRGGWCPVYCANSSERERQSFKIRTEITTTAYWSRPACRSFFHQDTIPLKGYPYEVRLIRAMQPAAEKTGSKRVLIVDIDVSTKEAVALENLDRTLDELRYIKNKVFFTYMKDADKHFK